jgi:hypothetical protein
MVFFDNSSLKRKEISIKYTAGRRKKEDDGYKAKAAVELLLYSVREEKDSIFEW